MEICTVGSVRGDSVGVAMVDLNGHEAGNGGYSQGTPKASRALFYSENSPDLLGALMLRPISLCARRGRNVLPVFEKQIGVCVFYSVRDAIGDFWRT